MKTQLVSYLNFEGNATEAMQFYHSIFGGRLEVQTFGEVYPDTSDVMKDRIMHARLTAEEITIMASDTHPEFGPPFVAGNNVHLCIIGSDVARLTEYFYKLAEGGTVKLPLEKQVWGDTYGQLTDRFGVHWMVNIGASSESDTE